MERASVSLFAALCVSAAFAGPPAPPCAPLSPADLARALEARVVSGEGAVFPDPDKALVLLAGSVRLDVGDWPEPFIERAGETISASISPDSGLYEFRDAEGSVFWTVAPAAEAPQGWVAAFRRASDSPAPSDPLFDPSRIVLLWKLRLGGVAESQDTASPSFATGPKAALKVSANPARDGDAESSLPENLSFSGFSVSGVGELSFSARWPDSDPPPEGVLDVYETDLISPAAWHLVATVPAVRNPSAFVLEWPAMEELSPGTAWRVERADFSGFPKLPSAAK